MVVHVCNPRTLGGRGRWITRSRDRDHPGQHGETLSLMKIQKLAGHGGFAPVVPATREAEAEELLEPRRQGCNEPRLRHCTPAWGQSKKDSISKKKKKRIKSQVIPSFLKNDKI